MIRRLALLAVLALAGCPAPSPEEQLPPGPTPGITTAMNAHVPPFARWPYQPLSREAAVQIALREWRAFGQQVVLPNTELPVDEEREEGLWQRVGEYWWLGLDPRWKEQAWTGIHNENGQVFPESQDGNYAWSAAFTSYVMRMAGAGNRFPYSETHSDYINAARRHGLGIEPGTALTAERIEVYAPQRGDLICYWRGRRPVTYDDLPTGRFGGHCDIVVAIKPGELDVIGGNVDNAVAMKHIPATADGHLAGPDGIVLDPDHHYFVVLRVEYER
ncbi:MAG TPA: DUF2272 domain-containing protein [Stellaceae bacterium]|nr:DUF2272 domain-containing protein [Stellaceae bacterium]